MPAGQGTTIVIVLSIGHLADATPIAIARIPRAMAQDAIALRMMRMLPSREGFLVHLADRALAHFILGAGLLARTRNWRNFGG